VPESQRPVTEYQVVSPSYFATLDLPILEGRVFDERDRRDGVPVCIVNEALARSFHGRSPIGQRVALRPTGSPQAQPEVREIVGIARQVKGRPDEVRDFVQVYVPMAQNLSDDVFLVVRPAAGTAEALVPSVRAAISRVDKEQLVSVREILTLDDIAWRVTGRHRFRAVMVVAFAALALILAMVGLFGILAYSVQQHVRDFGVRRALGATTSDVLRLVIVNAATVIGAGAAIGLVLAAIGGGLIRTVLFGVQPLDMLTFAMVIVVLALGAALSIVGPAWRVARIDPASALRSA
jgi:putative ABC transport system permease protein